jgi:biotin-dependent carboxylase-like uncharacterized protein
VRIHPLGEEATLLDLDLGPLDDRAARTDAAARWLRSRGPDLDVAVGGGVLLISGPPPPADWLAAAAAGATGPLAPAFVDPREPLRIEVVYDGPDLDAVAGTLGVAPAEVVSLHAGARPRVELLGFLPGFAYLGPVPAALALPRRPTPRPVVPARSVAIAAGFTGVYPAASPGGWHLLGRAPTFRAFDPSASDPFLLTPGRLVQFVPVDAAPATIHEEMPVLSLEPALRVVAAPACATIQDRGRPGRLGVGLPPSGPLDPEAHARANRAAGNAPGAAAIEIPLGALEVEALRSIELSVDGEPPRRLAPGERLRVPACGRAVRYLGVRGGVEVPVVLGSRSTLLSARLGGFAGRPLRRGDTLAAGPDAGPPSPSPPLDDPPAMPELRLVPGPHLDRFAPGALDAFCRAIYRVSRLGDRVGVRLEGPPVEVRGGRLDRPAPMVRGCIEIATDGTPILLGPDHPTTGGYPVIATLTRASQTLLARLAPGHELRFALALPAPNHGPGTTGHSLLEPPSSGIRATRRTRSAGGSASSWSTRRGGRGGSGGRGRRASGR